MTGLDSVTDLQRLGLERLHCVEFLIMYVTSYFPICRFMFTLLRNATMEFVIHMQGFFQEIRQGGGGAKFTHEEYVEGKSKTL